jgi:hypothetical protein
MLDPNYNSAVCGSRDLDTNLFLSIAIVCSLAVCTYLYFYTEQTYFPRLKTIRSIHISSEYFTQAPEMVTFVFMMRHLTMVACFVTLFSMVVLLPPYSCLKLNDAYSLVFNQYNWYTSAVMLRTTTPAVTIYIVWAVLILILFWVMVYRRQNFEESIIQQLENDPERKNSIDFPRVSTSSRITMARDRLLSTDNKYFTFSEVMILIGFFQLIFQFVCLQIVCILIVKDEERQVYQIFVQFLLACVIIVIKIIFNDVFDLEIFERITIASKAIFLTILYLLNSIFIPVTMFVITYWSCFGVTNFTAIIS